jgi:hypothetical protein
VAAVGATECDVITSFTNPSKCIDRRREPSLQQSFPPTTSQAMRSLSMICADGAFTVSKLPNVFGTVPTTVKTGLRFRNPLNSNGIGVMLE